MPSVLIHTSHEPLNHFRAQLKDELNKINDEEKKKKHRHSHIPRATR